MVALFLFLAGSLESSMCAKTMKAKASLHYCQTVVLGSSCLHPQIIS